MILGLELSQEVLDHIKNFGRNFRSSKASEAVTVKAAYKEYSKMAPVLDGIDVEMLDIEDFIDIEKRTKNSFFVGSLQPRLEVAPSPDEFIFDFIEEDQAEAEKRKPTFQKLEPPPRIDPPPNNRTFPRSQDWDLEWNPAYANGWIYTTTYNISQRLQDITRMAKISTPPECTPKQDGRRFIGQEILGCVRMIAGVPYVLKIDGKDTQLITAGCVQTPQSLYGTKDYSKIMYLAVKLARFSWGVKSDDARKSIPRLSDLPGLKKNDRSPKFKNSSSNDGSYSLASTVMKGEGQGNIIPAVQANSPAVASHIATVLRILNRLFRLIMPLCISKLEMELFDFNNKLNNVFSFGGLEPNGTSCQLNVSSMAKDLFERIGFQGSWHTDVSDDITTYTLFTLLINAGPEADPGMFFLGRHGIYVRELDAFIIWVVFKGTDLHSGFAVSEDPQAREEWVDSVKSAWDLAGPENRMGFVTYSNTPSTQRKTGTLVTPPTHFGNGGVAPAYRKNHTNFAQHGQVALGGQHAQRTRIGWELFNQLLNGLAWSELHLNLDIDEIVEGTYFLDEGGEKVFLKRLPIHPTRDQQLIQKMRGYWEWYRALCQSVHILLRRADYKAILSMSRDLDGRLAVEEAFNTEYFFDAVVPHMTAAYEKKLVGVSCLKTDFNGEPYYEATMSNGTMINILASDLPAGLSDAIQNIFSQNSEALSHWTSGPNPSIDMDVDTPGPSEQVILTRQDMGAARPSALYEDHSTQQASIRANPDRGGKTSPAAAPPPIPSLGVLTTPRSNAAFSEEQTPSRGSKRTHEEAAGSTGRSSSKRLRSSSPTRAGSKRKNLESMSDSEGEDEKEVDEEFDEIVHDHRFEEGRVEFQGQWQRNKGIEWISYDRASYFPAVVEYCLEHDLISTKNADRLPPLYEFRKSNSLFPAGKKDVVHKQILRLLSLESLEDDLDSFKSCRPQNFPEVIGNVTTNDIFRRYLAQNTVNSIYYQVSMSSSSKDTSPNGIFQVMSLQDSLDHLGKPDSDGFLLNLAQRALRQQTAAAFIGIWKWYSIDGEATVTNLVTAFCDDGYDTLLKREPTSALLINHIAHHIHHISLKAANAKLTNQIVEIPGVDVENCFGPRPNCDDLAHLPSNVYGALPNPTFTSPVPISQYFSPSTTRLETAAKGKTFWKLVTDCVMEVWSGAVILEKIRPADETLAGTSISPRGMSKSWVKTGTASGGRAKGKTKAKPEEIRARAICRGALYSAIAEIAGGSGIFLSESAEPVIRYSVSLMNGVGRHKRTTTYANELLKKQNDGYKTLKGLMTSSMKEQDASTFKEVAVRLAQEVHIAIRDTQFRRVESKDGTSATFVPRKAPRLVTATQSAFCTLEVSSIVKSEGINLLPVALILREALLNQEGKVGDQTLHKVLTGHNAGLSSNKTHNPEQTNPIRRRMEIVSLLRKHIPPEKATTPAGISNLLSFMGTGQGHQTTGFLHLVDTVHGGFFKETCEEMARPFEWGIAQQKADSQTKKRQKASADSSYQDFVQFDDCQQWGQASNQLSVQPTDDKTKLKLTPLQKFGPYFNPELKAAWTAFLGDMANQNPEEYTGLQKKSWYQLREWLASKNLAPFGSGLTAIQFCNSMAIIGIVTPPTPNDMANWIYQHPKLGAIAGLRELGFSIDDNSMASSIIAFESFFYHLDRAIIDDSIRNTIGVDPILAEHLLCKVSRWAGRLRNEYSKTFDWEEFDRKKKLPFQDLVLSQEAVGRRLEQMKADYIGYTVRQDEIEKDPIA